MGWGGCGSGVLCDVFLEDAVCGVESSKSCLADLNLQSRYSFVILPYLELKIVPIVVFKPSELLDDHHISFYYPFLVPSTVVGFIQW